MIICKWINFFNNCSLNLNSETWGREVCELINYDSRDLFKSTIKIEGSGHLYRLQNRIFFTKEETSFTDYEELLKIDKIKNSYELSLNKYKTDEDGNITTSNSAWFLLKKYKMEEKINKYKLHTGDIIKIGRIVTRIKEIKYDKNSKKDDKSSFSENDSINKSKESNSKILKDIGDFTNEKEVGNNQKQKIYSLANQRNATDPDLKDKIQVLNLNKNKIIDNNKLNADEENNINDNSNKNNKIQKKNLLCRICYMEEEDAVEDPLVQPCKCSGSLKYIHLKCLKHWIFTRSCMKVESNECCSVFVFKEVECEICKTKLPDLISHNGKLHSLLDFSEDFKNYLIIETLTLDDEDNKFLYVISLDKNRNIKLGRGLLSEVLLSDVSVSRIHCMFSIEGRNVYIKDNNSKFGTLVLVQTPKIKITENLPLSLQVGRTYLNFILKKEEKLFSCCEVSENPDVFYHYKQNEKQVKLNKVWTVKIDKEEKNYIEEDEKDEDIIKDVKSVVIDDIKSKINDKDESIKIMIENEEEEIWINT